MLDILKWRADDKNILLESRDLVYQYCQSYQLYVTTSAIHEPFWLDTAMAITGKIRLLKIRNYLLSKQEVC